MMSREQSGAPRLRVDVHPDTGCPASLAGLAADSGGSECPVGRWDSKASTDVFSPTLAP